MTIEAEPRKQAKYLEIVEGLRKHIGSGRYRPGARLPSQAELVRKFKVSRMTVDDRSYGTVIRHAN